MLRTAVVLTFLACSLAPCDSILNSSAFDTSQFNVTTFASGLGFPEGMVVLPDGSLAVETSPGYTDAPGQILRFTSTGNSGVADGPGTVLYQTPDNALLTRMVQVGPYYAVGNFVDKTITLLQPGATPSAPWTSVAVMQFNYPDVSPGVPWEHSSAGLAVESTPGQPGSYTLVFNVGSAADSTASTQQVGLTATGFSDFPSGPGGSVSLNGDSLYSITINTTGAQPSATNLQQVADGIRNVFGMAFQPGTGDFYFADNGIDYPLNPDGFSQQADELDFISAANFADGMVPNFGFPNCYTQYETGIQIGSGCVQPLAAFQPIDGHNTNGVTEIAFAPANFPAPFNDGVFVGFTGEGGGPGDPDAGLDYYDIATGQYLQFIQGGNPAIADILGVTSTDDALFVSDFGTGTIYEITAASPEPGTGVMLGAALIACLCGSSRPGSRRRLLRS